MGCFSIGFLCSSEEMSKLVSLLRDLTVVDFFLSIIDLVPLSMGNGVKRSAEVCCQNPNLTSTQPNLNLVAFDTIIAVQTHLTTSTHFYTFL